MKYKPGIAIGEASGKIGSAVASHNRYGPYFRVWAKPVNGLTGYQIVARDRLIAASQNWRTLNANTRAAWDAWAQVNPIVDRLGMKQVLTGHAAFVQINCVLAQMGAPALTAPPVAGPPTPFTACSLTADIGAGNVALVYTPTPTGAGVSLYGRFAVTNSTSRRYFKNLLKTCVMTGNNEASPKDIQAAVETRLGTLQVGQFLQGMVFRAAEATGLLSAPSYVSAVVTST
jgi:hypothetical protein